MEEHVKKTEKRYEFNQAFNVRLLLLFVLDLKYILSLRFCVITCSFVLKKRYCSFLIRNLT